MFSVENYMKLKIEFHQLLTEGDELLEDDESFLEQIITTMEPNGVLGLVKDLKEEGNVLFKQRKVDEALEKYGYAGIILTQYDFQDEAFMKESNGLALCLLLNSAACFGKKGHFDHVGRICTLILEFDSENVKALFRRVVAAIELGRNELAYWDLLLATQIDPNNLEVSRKLLQVKDSLSGSQSQKQHQEDTLSGLGVGVSLPAKKARKGLMRKDGEIDVVAKNKSVKVGKEEDEIDGQNKSQEKNSCTLESIDVDMDESLKENAIEIEEKKEAQEKGDVQEYKIVGNVEKNETRTRVGNQSCVNNQDQAEPTYRFSSRHRPGSFLSISRKDYELLKKGKSIQCFNSKIISSMTIRAVTCSKDYDKVKGTYNKQEMQGLVSMDVEEKMVDSSHKVLTFDSGNNYRDENIAAEKQPGILGKRKVSKIRRKSWSSLSVCDRSRKAAKSRLSVELNKRKSRLYQIATKCVKRKQGQQVGLNGNSQSQFRFSAVKRRNFCKVKHRIYRTAIKQMIIRKKKLIGQKRKMLLYWDVDDKCPSLKKILFCRCSNVCQYVCNDISSGSVSSAPINSVSVNSVSFSASSVPINSVSFSASSELCFNARTEEVVPCL